MISPMRRRFLITAPVAMAAFLGAAAWAAPGGAVTHAPALPIVKPGHVGQIQIGETIASLSARKLIGGLKPGCELDPGQRVAKLKPPLKGFAIFFHGGRRLSSLSIEGGAETAKGVRPGSTAHEARQAYPKADYDPPGSAKPFAEGFLWINNERRPKMTIVVNPGTKLVQSIDLPSPNLCE